MSQTSLHLAARDFDAYATDKASSNAYSRPRLELKQRALAWARGVEGRLAELGIAVSVHASVEHPTRSNKHRVEAQWVFFARDEEAREGLEVLLDQGRPIAQLIDDPSPYTRHAFLALRLDARAVEVCFALHPEAKVDIENLCARLRLGGADEDELQRDELMRALAALPEQFAIGVAEGERVLCSAATPEVIRSMASQAAGGQVPLWIGWSVPRETALEHADVLDDQLEDALLALAPIYRLVAWSRENDLVALDRRLEGVEIARARTHAEAEAQSAQWRVEREEARRQSQEDARARGSASTPTFGRAELNVPGLKPGATRTKSPSGTASASLDAAPRQSRRDFVCIAPGFNPGSSVGTESPVAAAPPPQRTPATGSAFERGARVGVRSGPFAGKVGVIGELDGRGGARVLLGLLSTRLELADLEVVVEGRERPMQRTLQSSHRSVHKPWPAAGPIPRSTAAALASAAEHGAPSKTR